MEIAGARRVGGEVHDTGGLAVVAGHVDAAKVAAVAMGALRHRGADGAAMAVADGVQVRAWRGATPTGLGVAELSGTVAVGCVWSGDGSDRLVSARFHGGRLAAAMVGRITNLSALRHELLEEGALLRSGSDVEVLLHLVARSKQRTFVNRVVDAVWKLEGAYVLTVCTPERLVVLRDPHGFRPAWVGRIGDAVVVTTDDVAIEAIGARVQRSLAPGEMLVADERGVQSIAPLPARPAAACTMEILALAPSHAHPFDEEAHGVRLRIGEGLAGQLPGVDVVVGMPGAAEEAALGLAAAARLPFDQAVHEAETLEVDPVVDAPRYRVLAGAVAGRRVLLVGPSLTTGLRERSAIGRLLAAGAVEVHLRCVAPPTRMACPYGVAMPSTDLMVVSRHPDPDDLASWLGANSVAWASGASLEQTIGGAGRCEACLSTSLPVDVVDGGDDDQLTLFA